MPDNEDRTPDDGADSENTPSPENTPEKAESTGESYSLLDPPAEWSNSKPDWNEVRPMERAKPSGVPVTPRRDGSATSSGSEFTILMGCNLLVFMSSVCIMVLELTASRLIAKHVGNSLYTWTSVIGVVLAGITIGNYLGGWLADRVPPKKILGWLFLIASILSFSVLWLDQVFAGMSRPEDWSWPMWVVVSVGGIFLLPSIALGTIAPVVASLALSHSNRTGMTVGNVYAWGALGSIVGTFLTGFLLIDLYGTKQIVGMTSAMLAVIAATIAGGQRVFRTAVVLGWLQFIFFMGLAASADSRSLASAGEWFSSVISFASDDDERAESFLFWSAWGESLGENVHQLGLILGLRDDDPDEYHDESNYSYINVSRTTEDGDQIKYLKLDKLIHSYYNPADPTKLYYDYELIYAAVTEHSAAHWQRSATARLKRSAIHDQLVKKLPAWVSYDEKTEQLKVSGAISPTKRGKLLSLIPAADYWSAVKELHRQTQLPNWGGFSSVSLEALPKGVEIPQKLYEANKVRFDATLQMLNSYEALTDKDLEQLLAAGDSNEYAEFHRAATELYGRSRQIKTMFIGGGGFIFPRWVEAEFPYQPRIDVAELDPAVKLVVQLELGLPDDGKTAVNTTIGDARNIIDDQLRANKRRAAKNEPPVLYDFVYGDAFNDFSVPWHLTTKEFSDKVKRLLNPQEGIYLVNIIDIYPRTELPDQPRQDDVEFILFDGEIPEQLLENMNGYLKWQMCEQPFESFELLAVEDDQGYGLGVRGKMTEALRDRLLKLDPKNGKFNDAVREMFAESRRVQSGRFLGGYVNTMLQVFPNIYVFSSEVGSPHDSRDTFVIIASMKKLDLTNLGEFSEYWTGMPFAWAERNSGQKENFGQMDELLESAGGIVLTDDYAPVDNLLKPVFIDQD